MFIYLLYIFFKFKELNKIITVVLRFRLYFFHVQYYLRKSHTLTYQVLKRSTILLIDLNLC